MRLQGKISGLSEAAKILGVSRQRVQQLSRSHPDFPKPVARLAATTIWMTASLEEFDRNRQKTSGPRVGKGST